MYRVEIYDIRDNNFVRLDGVFEVGCDAQNRCASLNCDRDERGRERTQWPLRARIVERIRVLDRVALPKHDAQGRRLCVMGLRGGGEYLWYE